MLEILAQDSPLIPPTPLDDVIPSPLLLWWQWALIAIGVILILTVILLIMKFWKKKPPVEVVISPLKVAEEKLTDATHSELTDKELFLYLSVILREYITTRFYCPTLFETNEEINAHHFDKLNIPEPKKQEAVEFINQLEKLKYGDAQEGVIIPQEIIHSLSLLIIQLDREWQHSQQSNTANVS